MLEAPKVDERSAAAIFEQLERELASSGDELATALLRVFARYSELIIQRLNRAPDKHYLAFLDALNLSRRPPVPAEAPLTFRPVTRRPAGEVPVIVPAHTKVAAAPGPGEDAPVVFETAHELALSDVTLERVVAFDPTADLWSDKSDLASDGGTSGEFAFLARTPVAHEFYVRHDGIFGRAGFSRLGVRLDLAGGAGPVRGPLQVEWRIPAPKGDIVLHPVHDSTVGLRTSGDVIFTEIPEWPEYELFGRPGRWLACRLVSPLVGGAHGSTAEARDCAIGSIALSARWQLEEAPVLSAYASTAALDLTRDFYPFGEHPRFNDVLYLSSAAFHPGNNVAVNVTLTNPASGPIHGSVRQVTKVGQPVIRWEVWNGHRWAEVIARDGTEGLTESGEVLFTVPPSAAATVVNGEAGNWVRARLVAGNYGEPERFQFTDGGTDHRIAATQAPPSIQSLTVSSWSSAGPSAPDALVVHNNFVLEDVAVPAPFLAFRRARDPGPALYVGFRLPDNAGTDAQWQAVRTELSRRLDRQEFEAWIMPVRMGERTRGEVRLTVPSEDVRRIVRDRFMDVIEDAWRGIGARDLRVSLTVGHPLANRNIVLYCHVRAPKEGPLYLYGEAGHALPRLMWQYWSGERWRDAETSDGTAAMTVPGAVTIRLGPDVMPWRHTSLGPGLYWVRALWTGGEYGCRPDLTRVLVNTVVATQTMTMEDELLGSSNGKPRQKFRTARVPVLADLGLEVREPDMPESEELMRLREAWGDKAVTPIVDPRGQLEGVWVRWREVDDLSSCFHGDRCFTVDRETGEIAFGDDVRGRIPPAGTNNVRLRWYRTGGGARGNRRRGTIEQLRTTVPYVDKVSNPEDAVGGYDAEDWESVRERGSRWLRHRDRAVTAEDYADIAKLASPLVARARCYSSMDAARDPLGVRVQRGSVSIVVVPHGSEERPRPDLELLRRVRDVLSARCPPDARLVVVAPRYIRIGVDASVAAQRLDQGASVMGRCTETLSRFLHPVTGGHDGRGWEFGVRPHESDLYAQLEAVEGLSYVRSLRVRIEEELDGLLASGSFLISSGEHRIRLET